MRKLHYILKLSFNFIGLGLLSCTISHQTSKETIIADVINEVAGNNNCKIKFDLNAESNILDLLVTNSSVESNDYLNGLMVLELFQKLKDKGVSNCKIKIADKRYPKAYIKLDPKGYVRILNMKKRSKSYERLLQKDNKKFYNLIYEDIRQSVSYEVFSNVICGNLKKEYNAFGGFRYTRINSIDLFFFKWNNKKNDIVIGLNELDSFVYEIQVNGK